MSVSAIFGSSLVIKNPRGCMNALALSSPPSPSLLGLTRTGAVIECSSRPQKKATAHHMKTRPKKTAPWDIKRRPTVYPPLPPLPPEWTLVTSSQTSTPPPNNED